MQILPHAGIVIFAYLFSAGIAATGVLYGIFLTAKKYDERPFLLYTLLSLAICILQISTASFHIATSLESAVFAMKWMNFSSISMVFFLTAFLVHFFGIQSAKRLVLVVAAMYILIAVINFLMPYGIRFDAVHDFHQHTFMWGETLNVIYGQPSKIVILVKLLYLAFMLWGIYVAYKQLKDGNRINGVLIGAGFVTFILSLIVSNMIESSGQPMFYIGAFCGLAFNVLMIALVTNEVHVSHQTAKHLAYYDELTDLPKRSIALERIDYFLRRARTGESQFAVALINIDRFDNINDLHGRDSGNAVLQVLAKRLSEKILNEFYLARNGSDEFLIVMPDVPDAATAKASISRILKEVFTVVPVGSQMYHIAASAGIALGVADGNAAELLVSRADLALREAKRVMPGSVMIYNSKFTESIVERARIGDMIRDALANGEFSLYLQPQINVHGEIAAFETLIRWNHPREGFIPPDKFIPIAEETGSILNIGSWVVDEACRILHSWKLQGINKVKFSINLSVVELQQDKLARNLEMIINKHGLEPSMFDFEVTETTVMENMQTCISQLQHLRNIGACVSVDDFGTGYSSLGYLDKLPINILKIDRVFVQDLQFNANRKHLLTAVINLAHKLKMTTIAEGVETQAQASLLFGLGCDKLQGYHIARPMPANEALAFYLQSHDVKPIAG